jgi:hypothetical protein
MFGDGMSESALDQIVLDLRSSGSKYFSQHGEVKAARMVGHTPKPDHYTYEIVLDFPDGSERVNAKIYRGKNASRSPQESALREAQNLHFAHETAQRRTLGGVPRPIGDFADMGAVVSTKVNGLPLQSIIMKAALLPGDGNHQLLEAAARQAGEWLQRFHRASAGMPMPLDGAAVVTEMEELCARAQKDGLPPESTEIILSRARAALAKLKRPLRSSAVLHDFIPLNVLVAEDGIGFSEFAAMSEQGHSLLDAAMFLAAIEVLEKYPFCNRNMTSQVQDAFVAAYGVTAQEEPLLDTLKMKVLLQMFAQGRAIKESAERKKVMWANVMKRFIQRAAGRSTVRVA